MMNYRILANKPEIEIVKDGERTEMKDLLAKSFSGSADNLGHFVKVNKYYVARPDLLSFALYGTDMYADVICKINGISNPFELNEGMVVLCPLQSFITSGILSRQAPSALVSPKSKTNSNGTNDNVFKDFTTSMLSNGRLKHDLLKEKLFNEKEEKQTIGDSAKSGKKLKNERRSPVEQTVEDSNYTIDKTLGIVIY